MLASKIVAPQNWKLPLNRATCHGIGDGAASPPTILSASFIKDGMSARKNTFMIHGKLDIMQGSNQFEYDKF